MQRSTTRLRALVKRGKFLELPSAYDPLIARLAESLGFQTVYNGGFVTGGATCISEPLLTMDEQIRVAAGMAKAVSIPVIMDAGAGWGEPLHTMRTVREAIRAGIAGVHIEDQLYPKRAHYHKYVAHAAIKARVCSGRLRSGQRSQCSCGAGSGVQRRGAVRTRRHRVR